MRRALSEPHGTHRVCLKAGYTALDECKNDEWINDCYVWLYRGAWQKWDINEIEMAVPLSPQELSKKRKAIFKYQSQKDRPLFPGPDEREFWQRSEQRAVRHDFTMSWDLPNMKLLKHLSVIKGWKNRKITVRNCLDTCLSTTHRIFE